MQSNWIRRTVGALFVVLPLLPATAIHAKAPPKLDTEEAKTLYALGIAVGQNLARLKLTPDELAIVQRGVGDSAMGRKPKVSMPEYGPKIQGLAKQRVEAAAVLEKKASTEFLTKQAAKKGAKKTESGLIITTLKKGTGKSPTAEEKVKVHYHGTLRDGTVFDSSVERGEPVSFPLKGVIPCWTEGVQMMKVGGKSRLVCPPSMAYGDDGRPGIPGGAALVFEVELIAIEAAEPPAAP